MKRFIDYNKKLKERTKALQKAMTVPEKKLRFDFFKKLEQITPTPLNKGDFSACTKNKVPLIKGVTRKSRGIENMKSENQGIEKLRIYKQKTIDNFIVDFYIPKYKLVIEVDGESHLSDEGKDYDIERTQILEGMGLKVIRYTNKEIMENFTGVCEDIRKYFI